MSSQQQIPPRPDGLHPVPAMPPRPDALDATDDLLPKATWSWYEALVVYFLAFLLAGLATLPLIRVMEPETDLTNIVLTVVAAIVILAVLLLWLQVKHPGWLRVMRLPEPGTWGKQIGSGVLFGLGLYPVMVFVVGWPAHRPPAGDQRRARPGARTGRRAPPRDRVRADDRLRDRDRADRGGAVLPGRPVPLVARSPRVLGWGRRLVDRVRADPLHPGFGGRRGPADDRDVLHRAWRCASSTNGAGRSSSRSPPT